MEDIRRQLAEAFAAEHAEHVAALRAALVAAEAGGDANPREMFRRAHSLKGAARAVDRDDIEGLAHLLEALLAEIETGRRALDPAAIVEARDLIDAIEDLAHDDDEPAAVDETAEPALSGETVRIAGRTIEGLSERIRALQGDLEARALIASDLRGTRAEVDAIRAACLQPGASLIDIAGRLARLLTSSNALAARRVAADWQVERTAAALADEAERILLAPAAELAEGQERLVRAMATEAGKEAELIVMADAAEADRRVLQALRDPLNHLLRNAISHGVEPAGVRARAGKPARARVTLELRAERGQLLLAVSDDGPGPDVPAIVAVARERGVLPAGLAAPPEEEALALVFEHGVSTSGAVDRLSGRGLGLAIVADAARRLHGTVAMRRAAGGGTRLELIVPLTLTRRALMLVEAGGQTFAIAARAAFRAARFEAARIVTENGRPALRVTTREGQDRMLPIVSLAALLGLPVAPVGEWVQAFALRVGVRTYMISVDALRDVRLLSFGDAGAIAADVPMIVGTALIEDGTLALVLSPDALVERILRGHAGDGGAAALARPEPQRQRTVLIVDDSITTRTLERGILEGQGYRVLMSVDGIDGIETLRAGAGTIDLVIADVEMPRMDGFGLLSAIRNDPGLAGIPVIMMTSRNSPDDIQRGLDLGADAYVTKQEFEQGALLAAVGRLI